VLLSLYQGKDPIAPKSAFAFYGAAKIDKLFEYQMFYPKDYQEYLIFTATALPMAQVP